MATFTLTWDPTMPSPGTQIVKWRQKGNPSWITTTNVTPVNSQDYDATTATVGVLPNNWVYQFQVDSVCDGEVSGTSSSAIYEDIVYQCVTPFMGASTTSGVSNISVSFGPIGNIDSVYAVLIKSSGNVFTDSVLLTTSPFTYTFTGLAPNTSYYIKYIMYSVVNGITVSSSDPAQLGTECTTSPITTPAQ